MMSKNELIASLTRETEVCKHLHSKMSADQADYRLGEGMRNNLELLQYLTFCAEGPAHAMISGDWSGIMQYQERASQVTFESFPSAMDSQLEATKSMISDLSDEDLARESVLPWGDTITVGAGLIDMSLKFLTAYKLQLFCHLKANGQTELGTMNAWLGMDAPPAE